ncbi:MAG: alpha/beta hydrolase [Chrysiogenetes bacterium]|nr:alpha/beta hydrolase [Chrysiogenetes bacterium]
MNEPIEYSPVSRVMHGFFRYLDYAAHVAALNLYSPATTSKKAMSSRLIQNYPYIEDGSRSHLLDVWVPAPFQGKSPVVFYVHGGGFTFGSKDTHRIVGKILADHGYLTFMINYRLAPKNPYPASIEDACHALCWVWDHLEHFGGDPERFVIAGESAGGNLAAMLAVINSYKRPELFAQEVWARQIPLAACIPFCGWHDPGAPDRYKDHPVLRQLVPVFKTLTKAILGKNWRENVEKAPLFSPLPILANQPDRPLPPFLIPVGSNDPIVGDSRRLKKALDKIGVRADFKEHKGATHAHHILPIPYSLMRECWKDVFKFLGEPGIMGRELHAVA